MIPRKWEWVKEQCIRRGFKNAAKLAGEIDAVLLDCYDVEHTEAWLSFSKTFDSDALAPHSEFMGIVTDYLSCTACMDLKFCENCSFGKIAGDCGDQTSLYRRFMAEMYWAWSKEEKGIKRK